MELYENYDKTRLSGDRNRKVVWSEISVYLQKYVRKNAKVLDLGSGYCDFINFIRAEKKFALDKYIDPSKFVSEGIICLFGDYSLMDKKVENGSLDVVFASNFFEHLDKDELNQYFDVIKRKLNCEGVLIILQPNYKLCYKNYFDDYTHVKAWTDVSLSDYLKNLRFSIVKCMPKFIPFSFKSRVPKNKLLVKLYLKSPIKPLAGQMLIIAKNGG